MADQPTLFAVDDDGTFTTLAELPPKRSCWGTLERAYKELYVRDLLENLGYENVPQRDIYDCYEAAALAGFVWDGDGWVPEE